VRGKVFYGRSVLCWYSSKGQVQNATVQNLTLGCCRERYWKGVILGIYTPLYRNWDRNVSNKLSFVRLDWWSSRMISCEWIVFWIGLFSLYVILAVVDSVFYNQGLSFRCKQMTVRSQVTSDEKKTSEFVTPCWGIQVGLWERGKNSFPKCWWTDDEIVRVKS